MSYVIADNIITSIGLNTSEVLDSIESGKTGIVSNHFSYITKAPVALINKESITSLNQNIDPDKHTFFEYLTICSVRDALSQTNVSLTAKDTLLIVSTTKGNIELLETNNQSTDGLVASAAQNIANHFRAANKPFVVCNACISGVLALSMADRYINSGKYKHIVVTGADVATDFVVSGFESFKSMSEVPCKPFDKDRTGLSLGEGAGTIILGNEPIPTSINIKIAGSGSANDANHISGPSRTGEGAFLAAERALEGNRNIDFISAHGTATPYNDDMESVAINRIGLKNVPVNSFKGYFGHTLGAAGIIESIITIHSLKKNRLFKTLGLDISGLKEGLTHIIENQDKNMRRVLKMASGFGGCNAAIVFEKDEK